MSDYIGDDDYDDNGEEGNDREEKPSVAYTIYPSEEAYANRTEEQKARDRWNGSIVFSSPEAYANRNDKRTPEQKLRDRQMAEEQERSCRISNSRYGSWDW